ncbi:glutathione S-transferase family protein [Altererythrobacter sp. ZODW24]|uniref:glutathione S-transferase family protein n=1 Tax=Altererythrobacter sp. ZODW24 TaxID=2185142 RepID=UPI000DF7E0AF|nr:glutathione S-transferase family protein [Altererythrobacter sp. ZODW24]
MSLTLYHSPQSTCSQKVRLAFAEKGLTFRSELVDLFAGEQHAPHYVTLNPNHVVPTLVDDGTVIIESTLIGEYLDHAFPDPSLISAVPAQAHATRLWTLAIDRLHAFAGTLTFAVGPRSTIASGGQEAIDAHVAKIPDPRSREAKRSVLTYGTQAPEFAEALYRFAAFLDQMESALSSYDWLAGANLSLADTSALPYVLRLEHLSMKPMIDAHGSVAKWYDRMRSRPSYAAAISEWIDGDMIAKMSGNSAECWPAIKEMLKVKKPLA